MDEFTEYNPLDYANLTRNCVDELMKRGPFPLPLTTRFAGAGVYALFYWGEFPPYARIRSPDASHPIYVGKAIPPGGRKGRVTAPGSTAFGFSLFGRLAEHAASIQAAENLELSDFLCRFLVVTPLWITMAERFLIEHYRPIWNVCLDGFGLHDPGSGRNPVISWWDALHPGRQWKAEVRRIRTMDDAVAYLAHCMEAPPAEPVEGGDDAEV